MLREYASEYKKVGFVGMGVSNLPVIKLFVSVGAECIVRDKKDLSSQEYYDELKNSGVKFINGEDYLAGIDEELLFLSPAVRPDIPELLKAKENGTRITSEMEEFFRLCKCRKIAVTGSDGKTTTTTLISLLLKKAGYKVFLGGNIGINLFASLDEITEDSFAVVELSSFQLMKLPQSPDIAVMTNIAPNHLDWHKDMDEYVKSKKNIFLNQSADSLLVLNIDDDYLPSFIGEQKGRYVTVSGKKEADIYFDDEGIKEKGGKFLVRDEDIKIVGRHNRYNYCEAYSAVKELVTPDVLCAVASEFGGVEHRIEFVRKLDGVSYYNSSIDSSPSRTKACLESFKEKVIVISGGYDKHIPYAPLGELFLRKVKFAVLCGATAPKIKEVLDSVGFDAYIVVDDFEKAVLEAKKAASDGDNVVLTPASASFDMFKNFAERGNVFKSIVNKL